MIDFNRKEKELIKRSLLQYQSDLAKVSFAYEGEMKDVTNLIDKINSLLVISSDNCIVCGSDVRKDSTHYDVNGVTICESCMNFKRARIEHRRVKNE